MEFRTENTVTYVPDGIDLAEAIGRTTHLAVGAHQDDIPIMAYDGIRQCSGRPDRWFLAVTVTDGAGSPRKGAFARHTDAQMRAVRIQEENRAAELGGYTAAIQLGYPSARVKTTGVDDVVSDLATIIAAAKPQTVYIHNPADKHDTHVATALRALTAIQALPAGSRPRRLFGCEVWRDLDWLPDEDKVLFDYTNEEDLFSAVISAYESQLAGGKNYDLATIGRWRANATFLASHQIDAVMSAGFAIDLTPLISANATDVGSFMSRFVSRLGEDVSSRIDRLN